MRNRINIFVQGMNDAVKFFECCNKSCNAEMLQRGNTAMLECYNAVMLQRGNAAMLECYNAVMLQR